MVPALTMVSQEYLLALLYAYPLSLWAVLNVSSLILHHHHEDQPFDHSNRRNGWRVIWALQLCLVLSFATSSALYAVPYISAISQKRDYRITEGAGISNAAVFLYFVAGLLPDPEGSFRPTLAHRHAWITSACVELLLIALSSTRQNAGTGVTNAALSCFKVALLVCMCATHVYLRGRNSLYKSSAAERESLLFSINPEYGTSGNSPHKQEFVTPRSQSGWMDYFIGFRILFPYLWPSKNSSQQIILLSSLILVIGQRVVNIMVPYQLEQLIDCLGQRRVPYKEIALYTMYRGLQGQQGILGSLRAILWIPLSQSLFRRLTCAAFEHILSLSLEFHLSKKIGEVISALNKGSALNTFLDSFAFQLFPMVFDLGVAAAYFLIRLDPVYSLVIIAVMWCYIYMTIYMAMWRAKARREMASNNREMEAAKMDSMMSYETVHYNSAVPVETNRLDSLVLEYQKAEWRVLFSLNLLNITQNLVLTLGILLVVLFSALQIMAGTQTIPMFVGILGYFTQLQAPLQFFGSFYSQAQNNLIDAERMLDLFKEKPNIVDSDDASDLPQCTGRITFSDVSFAYDQRNPAIENLSFTAEPGTSTAIVGESGSGKSTCLKLLFRFYDPASGCIKIDNQDVRGIRLQSLRKHFGVVPQDTTLFNTSILYNIQYARPEATLEEVYEACRAASIHDKIMSFPERYETKVGERGLRLSGGEKQRIAIARAILKKPQIILLDEATASLDSHTEKQIQVALEKVTKGRTTITIAHRLSTITKCDQIIVLHQGKVIERGTHEELLAKGGRYNMMWEKQTNSVEELLQ